jgi:RNA-binding protein YlmH
MMAVRLDVAKAFDTIPHRVMSGALRRKGIPETMMGLIENSYRDIHTTITQGSGKCP